MTELGNEFKEGTVRSDALIFQATPDHSLGADVVMVTKERAVIVDGSGSGSSGNRQGAMKLMSSVVSGTEPLPLTGGTFVSTELTPEGLRLKAFGGGYCVAYLEGLYSGRLLPKLFYAGDDLNPQRVDRQHPIEGVKHLLLLSDGGVELLAEHELFGDRPEFKMKAANNMVAELATGEMRPGYLPSAFEDILLAPLTAILNETSNHQATSQTYSDLGTRFGQFQKKLERLEKAPLNDDSTLVLVPVFSSSS